MAKDPARRYSSASDMAEDLRRYLASEPIRARRVSLPERLWTWAKKERALAASMASVLALLVAAVVGSLFAVGKQTRLASEKAAETQRAEEQRDLAVQYSYFADMKTAHDDWQNGNTFRMLKTLKQHLPGESGKDLRDWEWYYLLSLAHRDEKTILGHEGQVGQICWSSDGQLIYGASNDGMLSAWALNGESVNRVRIPGLTKFAVSPAGDRIATVSGDPIVRIWDADTFELVKSIETDLPSAMLVDWSQQGDRLAVATDEDCQTVVLNTSSWAVETRLAPTSRCGILKFSPDGNFIVYGYLPTHVWSFAENKNTTDIIFGNIRSISVAWSPDSRQFVIGDLKRGCPVYELDQDKATPGQFKNSKLFLPEAIATSLKYSPDGRHILAGDQMQRVIIANAKTGQTEKVLQGHLDFVTAVDWRPVDSGHPVSLASAGLDGAIKLWRWQAKSDAESNGSSPGDESEESGTSPDGRWNWKASLAGTTVTDSQTDEVMVHIPLPARGFPYVPCYFFPEYHRMFLHNGRHAQQLAVWNTKTWQHERTWACRVHHCLQFVGDTAALVESDLPPMRVTLIDLRSLESRSFVPHHQLFKFQAPIHRYSDIALRMNADATRLLTASTGEVKIWDTKTLTETYTGVGHEPGSEMYSGVWSSTGRYVVSRGSDQTAKIWDTEAGRLAADLRGHQTSVAFIRFSADDVRVLTVGFYAKLWDVATGREILTTNVRETKTGKTSHEHVLSDFETQLVREFFVRNSKEDFRLPPAVLRFEALDKAVRLKRQANGIEAFQHASLHDLARTLVYSRKHRDYHPQRGLELAKQAVTLQPNSSDYHWTLALAQLRTEDYEDAIQTADRAHELDPENSLRCDLLRAYAQLMLENQTKARELYQNILDELEQGQTLAGAERLLFAEVATKFLNSRSRSSEGPILVTTLRDEVDGTATGDVSLREAVCMAAEGDRIEFAVSGEIQLQHGPIEINKAVDIIGPGPEQLTICASPKARIFTVRDNNTDSLFSFHLSGVRLTGGRKLWPAVTRTNATTVPSAADAFIRGVVFDPDVDCRGGALYTTEKTQIDDVVFEANIALRGGALFAAAGSTTSLRDCVFRNNGAAGFVCLRGGAVALEKGAAKRFQAIGCEFSGNQAERGGAVALQPGKAHFENCSFAGNQSRFGSCVGIGEDFIDAVFLHCTLAGNVGHAFALPGNSRNPVSYSHRLRLINSIVMDNVDESGISAPVVTTVGDVPQPSTRPSPAKLETSFCILDSKDNVEDAGNSLFNVDPLLEPLADNGGRTKTRAMLSGSPAIDAGTDAFLDEILSNDQDGRGEPRVADGDGRDGARPDIGAFEFQGE